MPCQVSAKSPNIEAEICVIQKKKIPSKLECQTEARRLIQARNPEHMAQKTKVKCIIT